MYDNKYVRLSSCNKLAVNYVLWLRGLAACGSYVSESISSMNPDSGSEQVLQRPFAQRGRGGRESL